MLVRLGARPPAAQDLASLLGDCHVRIRAFLGLARELARRESLEAAQVGDAAARVQRYFAVALPLHTADEEDSLSPRLRGRDPALDCALDRMAAEHDAHQPALAALLSLCEALVAAPGQHAALRPQLGQVVQALDGALTSHLSAEEELIFPAIARLSAAEREAVLREARARRAPA
jgi:iron-sulfur cluster repair protein YtfE (RIC family)